MAFETAHIASTLQWYLFLPHYVQSDITQCLCKVLDALYTALCIRSRNAKFIHQVAPVTFYHVSCSLWMHRYFRRLQKRHTPDARIKADLAQEQAQQSDDEQQASSSNPGRSTDASLQLPITCINLLRCNMQVSMRCSLHFRLEAVVRCCCSAK